MSRMRTVRRRILPPKKSNPIGHAEGLERLSKAHKLEAAVTRSRNAMRKKTGNNAQVRAQNKVLARRKRG